ncbi:hypothetical protein [Rhodonellum sp.]|uniref:hypothetical protein n=1 Tax=Rhodonellum sp. TaxID=2231180 RepID=UPI002717A74C|nr:hypothetical protein [Rhodonellum sp.]MDO9554893.1 hypothetical protein [Rhodonellum sp.]
MAGFGEREENELAHEGSPSEIHSFLARRSQTKIKLEANQYCEKYPPQFEEEISALIFWLLFHQGKSDKERKLRLMSSTCLGEKPSGFNPFP